MIPRWLLSMTLVLVVLFTVECSLGKDMPRSGAGKSSTRIGRRDRQMHRKSPPKRSGAVQEPSSTPNRLLYGSRTTLKRLWALFSHKDTPEHGTSVVLHLGDSHSAMGWFPRALRKLTGQTSSPGLVTEGLPQIWDVRVFSHGWKRHNWLHRKARGPFGPMGVALEARSTAGFIEIRPGKVGELRFPVRVSVLVWPKRHRPYRMMVDGRTVSKESTIHHGHYTEDLFTITGPFQKVTLVTRPGDGRPLRVFGFRLSNAGEKVEWHTLAVGGTTIYQTLRKSDPSFDEYVRSLNPDVVVVWFGTNILWNRRVVERSYERDFDAYLTKVLAAAPNAACLVISPPDLVQRPRDCFQNVVHKGGRPLAKCDPDALVRVRNGRKVYPVRGVHTEDEWQKYRERCTYHTVDTLAPLIEAQKRVALAHGCAYFDAHEFLGGDGAIVKMLCMDEPEAYKDLVHLRPTGYRRLAKGIVDALRRAATSDRR